MPQAHQLIGYSRLEKTISYPRRVNSVSFTENIVYGPALYGKFMKLWKQNDFKSIVIWGCENIYPRKIACI